MKHGHKPDESLKTLYRRLSNEQRIAEKHLQLTESNRHWPSVETLADSLYDNAVRRIAAQPLMARPNQTRPKLFQRLVRKLTGHPSDDNIQYLSARMDLHSRSIQEASDRAGLDYNAISDAARARLLEHLGGDSATANVLLPKYNATTVGEPSAQSRQHGTTNRMNIRGSRPPSTLVPNSESNLQNIAEESTERPAAVTARMLGYSQNAGSHSPATRNLQPRM
jgi:hypothetical protein